jgi:hypothetical protein
VPGRVSNLDFSPVARAAVAPPRNQRETRASSLKMGKCRSIIQIFDSVWISNLYSQPNNLTALAINKSVSSVSLVSTVSFRRAYNRRYVSRPITGLDFSVSYRPPCRRSETPTPLLSRARLHFFHGTKLPFRRCGEEEDLAGKVPRGGRQGGLGSLRLGRRGNDHLRDGRAVRGAASQSHSGRGKVLGRSPVYSRSKPECRFVSWRSCSRLHLRSRIQIVTRGEAQHGPPSRKMRCRTPPAEAGAGSRGLKRKPESVRKQEGNRNVIAPSRFLWLEAGGWRQWESSAAGIIDLLNQR